MNASAAKKYAALLACAVPFAALAGIVPGKEGPLVRSEDSKPVFLVSTTGKWLSFSDSDKRRKEMAKAAAENPGYEWLYGEPNSIEKYEDIVSGGELVFEMAGKTK